MSVSSRRSHSVAAHVAHMRVAWIWNSVAPMLRRAVIIVRDLLLPFRSTSITLDLEELDKFPPILGLLLPPRFPGRNRLRPYPERKPRNVLFPLGKTGAGEGIRTLDPNLGNVATITTRKTHRLSNPGSTRKFFVDCNPCVTQTGCAHGVAKEKAQQFVELSGFIWLRELDLNQRPSGYEPDGRTSTPKNLFPNGVTCNWESRDFQ